MDIDLEKTFPNVLSQLLPFLLSFLDDALLLLLSRLGLHLPWLEWLSPVMLGCMVTYWAIQLLHYLYSKLIADRQQNWYKSLQLDWLPRAGN
jgi:hypothetical protein